MISALNAWQSEIIVQSQMDDNLQSKTPFLTLIDPFVRRLLNKFVIAVSVSGFGRWSSYNYKPNWHLGILTVFVVANSNKSNFLMQKYDECVLYRT